MKNVQYLGGGPIFDKKVSNRGVSASTYFSLLSLWAFISALAKGHRTGFHWSKPQDIPIILRLQDPSFLTNDFYTNSVFGSPRMPFSYIIHAVAQIGIDWYSVMFFLKILYIIAMPSICFLAIHEILKKWKLEAISKNTFEMAKLLLFLGLAFILPKIQGRTSVDGPFGWGMILNYHFFDPMTLSFCHRSFI